jgi:hypothetical protein
MTGRCDGGLIVSGQVEPERLGGCVLCQKQDWTEGIGPIIATISYSPPGTRSMFSTGLTTGGVAGSRFQLSDSSGKTFRLSVRNTTVDVGFSLAQVTAYSVAIASTRTDGIAMSGSRDLTDWADDQFYLWVNPTLTQLTECDGSNSYLLGVDDGAYATVCPPHTGPMVQQMSGATINALTVSGANPCFAAIWADVSAARERILEMDPYRGLPKPGQPNLPNLGSLDSGRFVLLSPGAEALSDPNARTLSLTAGTCQGSSTGTVVELSAAKYRSRPIIARGKSFSLDLQYMSSTAACKSVYFDVTLSTSRRCGTQSAQRLKGDLYYDLVYGSLAFKPTQIPVGDFPGDCKF